MKVLSVVFLLMAVAATGFATTLGNPCSTDDECLSGGKDLACIEKNGVKNCDCKEGKKSSGVDDGGNAICINVLNSRCESDPDCINLEGADCENNVCICKSGLLPEEMRCVSLSSEGPCNVKRDCQQRLGDNSECKQSKCICEEGYHQDTVQHTCVATKKLNDQCISSNECYQKVGEDPKNVLQCGSDGKCQCVEGFTPKGDRCDGASSLSSLSLALLAAVAVFLRL